MPLAVEIPTTPTAPEVVTGHPEFSYSVLVTDEVKALKGTSLRAVPNATLTLYANDGVTPATIYSDDNFTVANSAGTVVANAKGIWTAFLDPAQSPIRPHYKGVPCDLIPVYPDARESEVDLARFSAEHGFVLGETSASRNWVTEQLENILPGSVGSVSESRVQEIVQDAIDAIPQGEAGSTVDLSVFARFRGDLASRDIAITNTIPVAGYEAVPFIGADGKIYLKEATVSQAPTTPVTTPEAVDTITSLSNTHNHFDKAYISSTGLLSGATVSIRALARTLEECAVQGDQANFDLVLNWAESNFKRTASATAKDLYGSVWTLSGTSITSATVDTGAMLTVFASLVRAWNLWGVARYHETASKIFSDIVNYCVVEDEGRAYICIDETQKTVTANGKFGHHVNPGDGGLMTAHEPGSVNPVHLRAAKTFTGAAICDRLILGHYDMVNKMIQQNTPGLCADFCAYNTASHQISAITNGTNGWTADKSNSFGISAQRIGRDLLTDKRSFSATQGVTALGKLRAFYTAKWAADAKIVDTYDRNGQAASSTETTESAFIAALILQDNNSADTTAAAIRSTKIVTTLPTDANGAYFPNTVKGVTATTSRDEDLRSWLALARDQDRYIDIAKLGSNPSVGVIYPPGNGGTGTSTPVVIDNGTPSTPTVGTIKLYADTQSQAALYFAANGSGWTTAKKAGYTYGISRPSGFWISSGWGDSGLDYLRQYLQRCKDAGAAATVLIYDMPLRDVSGGFSSGGQATAASYKAFVSTKVVPICNEFPTVTKYFVCEPDSAADILNLSTDAAALRADLLKWNGAYLSTNLVGTKKLYLDAGHPRWHPAAEMAQILIRCGIENYTGFACNTSNTWSFDLNVQWAQAIRAIIGLGKHFTIDCGRNGAADGGTEQWANPPNRVAGKFPQAGNLGIDGLDLVCDWKRVGESDGASGDGAPDAGAFRPTYVWNDSLTQPGYNISNSLVSTSSGVWQRWPAGLAPALSYSGGQSGV